MSDASKATPEAELQASTTVDCTLKQPAVKGLGKGTALPAQKGKQAHASSERSNGPAADPAEASNQAQDSPALGPSSAAPKLPPRRTPAAVKSNGPAALAPQATASSPALPSSSSRAADEAAPPMPTKSAFMPLLPPRQATYATGPVLDPEEPPPIQKLRKDIHDIRVSLIRAAQRLGYDHENGLVKQVLYRLNLAEKLKAPWRRGKRLDPAVAASREASRLEQEQGSDSPLGFTIKMMLIGPTGSGKTQLINSLLSSSGVGHASATAASHSSTLPELVDPFEGATKRVQVVEGTVHGIRIVCVDTPGLVASAAATGYNGKVLQQIRRAYRHNKPDLVVYVDRLDASAIAGGELPALKVLSENLGAGLWLNTIVALSHAGSPPPCGPKGQMSFDTYANQRSHLLQQVIRSASGDNRLMNPTAFVDSHPNCRLNSSGQAVIVNGMPWKAHLYLMIVSAKLLADTESMLQMQDGSNPASGAAASSAASAAAMQQMMMMGGMGPPRQIPLPYMVSSLTQFSRPVKYPDHQLVMDTRRMEKATAEAVDPKQARLLVRQVKGRLLQLRQSLANKERMQRSFKNATLAGGKVTPEPPGLATKRPPSVHPPGTYRYRVPEPSDGWIVRPHIEAHGMDTSDGIEGLYLEKMAVAGRQQDTPGPSTSTSDPAPLASPRKASRRKGPSDTDRLLGGIPYRHYLSAQCSKEHKAIQLRSEASMYHDPLGMSTSTVSVDVQTSGGVTGMPMDALCTLRADLRRKGVLGRGGKATLGLVATRIAEGCKPHKGPAAVGLRLQQTLQGTLPGSAPCNTSAALAYTMSLPTGNVAADPMVGEREGCLGANLELITDLQQWTGLRHSLPLTLGANAMSYRNELMTGLAAAMQYQVNRSEMVGGRLQISTKGKAGLSLKVKSQEHWWAGLIAMAMPLGTLLLQTLGVLR